ncbi:hypothetical protein [uncultured Shimia sp.]|uniref:hypothetical protein n=1 Tax=uncultured Shimia sp. TaxID=573152 RepID=UPI00260FAA09|nr:hypothetical protein [uncultured Shimia sp.]
MTLTKRTFLVSLAALAALPSALLAEGDSILGEQDFRLTFTFNGPEGESGTVAVAPDDVVKAVDMGPKSGLPYLADIVATEAATQMAGFPVDETQALELIVREGLIGVAHGRVAIRDLPFELNDAGWTGVLSVTRPV